MFHSLFQASLKVNQKAAVRTASASSTIIVVIISHPSYHTLQGFRCRFYQASLKISQKAVVRTASVRNTIVVVIIFLLS